MSEENPLNHDQDAVLYDYKQSGVLKENEWQDLHMFFSPLRIPVGLTDEEIRICVLLYPLRKSQMDRRLKAAEHDDMLVHLGQLDKTIWDSILPDELKPSRVMTRKTFKEGIWKFLLQAHT